MPRRFSIPVPGDYVLRRDYCSYGYFLLWPNHWSVADEVVTRALALPGGPAVVRIAQPTEGRRAKAGRPLTIEASRMLHRRDAAEVRARLARMLRLDEPAERIGEFHGVDPRHQRSGRGRLMRSPTLFEDLIKTVTSCNVQWPSTVVMNRRLCEVAGDRAADEGTVTHAFPSAERLARTKPGTLRARCRVGYRDARIVDLSRRFAGKEGAELAAWMEDPATPDDALWESLLELPGIGPYAAANVMQLLGRYHRLPLDTESLRHGRAVLGMKGTDRALMKRLHAHYAPFGPHAFRSYWFELWDFYESKHGPSWTWHRDTTGTQFTASKLAV